MINDQALLHLLGRLEDENVQLREQLRKALERNRELEAAAGDDDKVEEPV